MINNNEQILLSSAQVRGARGLLNWTQSDLANRCGLTKATIANIENEKHHLTSKTARKMYAAFSAAGVEFLENDGLRNKVGVIKTIEGKDAIKFLFDDIYEAVKKTGGCIKASGIDEKLLNSVTEKEYISLHDTRMEKVKNLSFRTMISDEDFYSCTKKYIDYRKIGAAYFFPLPVYIYNRKIAYLSINPLKLLLIDDFHTFLFHSKQFDIIWDNIKNNNLE